MAFAVYTAVAFALAGAGVLLFVRHHGTAEAERAVTFHARFLADSILRDQLRSSDFVGPVPDTRRAALDRLFARQVLIGGTLRVTLYGRDGRVTYSSDHALIGSADPSSPIRAALGGRSSSRVRSIADTNHASQVKVLEATAPVALGSGAPPGAFALYQDYGPIARAARKAFLPVAGVLQLVLVLLYISFFPILRRVSERLRRQVEQIEHQAFHDGLTGLPNRALFRDRVEQALLAARRNGETAAILLLDLDRFKEINDSLGHESGDLLLQAVGKRLRSLARQSDTVARLGGDEFAILSPTAATPRAALLLAERIRRGTGKPFTVANLRLEVETSIGIALFPDHGEDVETLMRHADVAMYISKETHRPQVYTSGQDSYSPDRLALVGELREAMERGDLVAYYQPRIDFRTGEVRSVEALMRWRHPERGLLVPADFIPLAEHTALVRPLTRYVLDAALSQCRAWRDEGLHLGVAVNLFGRDLLDLGLPDEVGELLAKWELEPSDLELEITENTILSDPTRARAILERLGEAEVKLAIDDFGSGYSSLRYLKRLPVDVLKIDKSFVLKMTADEDDAAIVRSTIDLAHNLGLEVVAEGVETQETWDRLRELGCDAAQGFLISDAVPGPLLTAWLASQGTGQASAAGLTPRRHVQSIGTEPEAAGFSSG